MSEIFSLKWNDFKTTLSNSFDVLRQEKDFFDVTLVSDDEIQISAHKLVLSACSDFFKSILKRNSHSHPLLYLSGVDSTNLSHILDYIYCGEVQVYQEHLDSFLEVAQKLKIEGLISGTKDNDIPNSKHEEVYYGDPDIAEELTEKDIEFVHTEEKKINGERRRSIPQSKQDKTIAITTNDPSAADEVIQDHLVKKDGVYYCRVCSYNKKAKSDVTKHIETHITGLSYSCSFCEKTFRSRNSLNFHKSTNHKVV